MAIKTYYSEIFSASGKPHDNLSNLPLPPPWRKSSVAAKLVKPAKPRDYLEAEKERGQPIQIDGDVKRAVNAALLLRRPLLVTGKPGVGKSSLVSAVAYELRMGPVLRWPITSRTTVKAGLYDYDAVGRLQARDNPESKDLGIGDFLRLGALGTALYPTDWPRALLMDEIDKGDLDFPNDLLNILEEGHFEIPELARSNEKSAWVKLHGSEEKVEILRGKVFCKQFPFVVMTSNGEREFPAPFLRRLIRITIPQPSEDELRSIVQRHFNREFEEPVATEVRELIAKFQQLRATQELATDQLLSAVFIVLGVEDKNERDKVVDLVLKQLTTSQSTQ